MRIEDVAVALLAAGRSARFGAADKRLADLDGRPLIQWSAAAGRALATGHRFAITGPGDALEAVLPDYGIVRNPHPGTGLSGSLRHAAMAARDAGATAMLVLLADMPFVRVDHLRHMIEIARADPGRAIFSAGDAGPQPPALFPAVLYPALMALHGPEGARSLAEQANRVAADPVSLFDVDTPDDLVRAARIAMSIIPRRPD